MLYVHLQMRVTNSLQSLGRRLFVIRISVCTIVIYDDNI
jgi:hypothetical protein